MKFLLSALSIALATSSLAQAAPAAEPAATETPASLSAPSAAHLALARRFIALTEPLENTMEAMRAGFWQTASQHIEDEQQRLAAEQGVSLILARVEPILLEAMPAVLETYAQVYAREFSADELQQMIAFAESPAGNHYMSRFAALENDEALLGAQGELWEALMPIIEDVQREMCAEKAAVQVAAGNVDAKCPLSQPEAMSG